MELKEKFEQAVSALVDQAPNETVFKYGVSVAAGLGGLAVGGLVCSSLLAAFGLVAGGLYGAKVAPDLWLRYRRAPSP